MVKCSCSERVNGCDDPIFNLKSFERPRHTKRACTVRLRHLSTKPRESEANLGACVFECLDLRESSRKRLQASETLHTSASTQTIPKAIINAAISACHLVWDLFTAIAESSVDTRKVGLRLSEFLQPLNCVARLSGYIMIVHARSLEHWLRIHWVDTAA